MVGAKPCCSRGPWSLSQASTRAAAVRAALGFGWGGGARRVWRVDEGGGEVGTGACRWSRSRSRSAATRGPTSPRPSDSSRLSGSSRRAAPPAPRWRRPRMRWAGWRRRGCGGGGGTAGCRWRRWLWGVFSLPRRARRRRGITASFPRGQGVSIFPSLFSFGLCLGFRALSGEWGRPSLSTPPLGLVPPMSIPTMAAAAARPRLGCWRGERPGRRARLSCAREASAGSPSLSEPGPGSE